MYNIDYKKKSIVIVLNYIFYKKEINSAGVKLLIFDKKEINSASVKLYFL